MGIGGSIHNGGRIRGIATTLRFPFYEHGQLCLHQAVVRFYGVSYTFGSRNLIEIDRRSMADMETSAKEDFAHAFSLAKKALEFVGKFRTPPTPEIYAVWYRFAEESNPALLEQLNHATTVVGEVTREQLESLYNQFVATSEEEFEASEAISEGLLDEVQSLKSLIDSQLTASAQFGDTVNTASGRLSGQDVNFPAIQDCIDVLLSANGEMIQELRSKSQELEDSRSQIDQLRIQLSNSQKELMTDPLTGIGNRRFFEAAVSKALKSQSKSKERAYLLIVDLDDFKNINDSYGHAVGDEVIRFVAKKLTTLCEHAAAARFGGDEFCLVLHAEDAAIVQDLAESVQEEFSRESFQSEDGTGRLSVSIGVARLREEDTADSWLERADRLVYTAKESGGNCVRLERELS